MTRLPPPDPRPILCAVGLHRWRRPTYAGSRHGGLMIRPLLHCTRCGAIK